MLPLVAVVSVLFAASAPLAYHVQKRAELVADARGDAFRIAQRVAETATQRPRLWRYDAAKLQEWIAAEGLERAAAVAIHDQHGAALSLGRQPGGQWPPGLLWGRAVMPAATVWVGIDSQPMWAGTWQLALAFSLLAALLGLLLYLLPMRVVAGAEARVKELVEELALTLPEDERRRIARELHDGAGQALTAARLHLAALKRASDVDPGPLATISAHVDQAMDEVRRSTTALLPPEIEELGLKGALEQHCAAFARATRLEVVCQVGALQHLDGRTATACYRIVQEGLNNVVKHAGASRAWVRVGVASGALRLELVDNGAGFAPGIRAGSGLRSMQERAQALGGTLEASTDEGGGARIDAVLPVPP